MRAAVMLEFGPPEVLHTLEQAAQADRYAESEARTGAVVITVSGREYGDSHQ